MLKKSFSDGEINKNQKDDAGINQLFYENKICSFPKGDLIENILNYWHGNYKLLEEHHGYIQWLFPNLYQSQFNSDSSSLTRNEMTRFRESEIIAERLVRSYKLILDFYGIKLVNEETGELNRSEDYKKRYCATFLTKYHNHLRMRRILMHLNNVGFRRYAIQLVNFLKREMGINCTKTKLRDFPLKDILKLNGVQIWFIYGDHEGDLAKKKLLDKNCQAKSEEDYSNSIFFQKFEKKISPKEEFKTESDDERLKK